MLLKTDSNQVLIQSEEDFKRSRFELEQEDLAQQKRDAFTVAPDAAGMDITNTGARMGRPMSAWTFQQRLSRIGAFYFEHAKNDSTKMGIYVPISNVNDPSIYYRGNLMFVCGLESGIMPEFSIMEAEVKLVPDPTYVGGHRPQTTMAKEIRGWRTVLAMLLKKRIITAHDVEKHFQISLGRDSSRWQQLLAGNFDLVSDSTEITEDRANDEHNGDDERASDGDADREAEGEAEAWTEAGIPDQGTSGEE